MLEINLNNIEDLVLKDARLRSLMPDLQGYFDTWFTGQYLTGSRTLASRSKLELLQAIHSQHLAIISKYLDQEVSIRTFDSNVVTNRECNVEDTLICLDGLAEYSEIVVYRHDDKVHLTAWR